MNVEIKVEKGKETNHSKLKLIDDDGETIDDEIMLKAMIWGDVFCMNGDQHMKVLKKDCIWWH